MFKICQANLSHVNEIIELWKEFVSYHEQVDPFYTLRETGPYQFEKYIRESICSKDSIVLVVSEQGDIVAYSSAKIKHYPPISKTDSYCEISELAVKSGHRRQGIGRALVDATKDRMLECGIDMFEIRVSSRNQSALAFWARYGFKERLKVMCADILTFRDS
jgi:ribosomal protein S18 acetylase RimI-like enzyme